MFDIVPLEQWQKSDKETIKKAQFALQESEWPAKRIVEYIVYLCGRYHCSVSHLSTLAAAHEAVISAASRLHVDSFSSNQWVAIIRSLATDTTIDTSLFPDCVRYSTSEDAKPIASICSNLDNAATNVQGKLCRRNKSNILKHGLLSKIVYSLWSEPTMAAALAYVKSASTTSLNSLDEAAKHSDNISELLSIDWSDFELGKDLNLQLMATSLCIIRNLLRSTVSEVADPQRINSSISQCSKIHEKALSILFSTGFDLEESNYDSLATNFVGVYMDIIKDNLSSPRILESLELFVRAIPWLPSSAIEKQSATRILLWKALYSLLARMEIESSEAEKETQVESVEINQTVTLASPAPEDDTTPSTADWLDDILLGVPIKMDERAAGLRTHQERYSSMETLVCMTLQCIPMDITECETTVLSVLIKLCKCFSSRLRDHPDFEDSFSTLLQSSVSSTSKGEIVAECLGSIGAGVVGSDGVLTMILNGTVPELREEIAAMVVDELINKIKSECKSGELIDENAGLSMREIRLFAMARRVMNSEKLNQLLIDLLQQFSDMANGMLNSTSNLIGQVVSLLHIVSVGGGTISPLCNLYNESETCGPIRTSHSKARKQSIELPQSLLRGGYEGTDIEEISSSVREFAAYFLRQAMFRCPPHIFPLFTIKELTEETDYTVLTYMMRLLPFVRSPEGSEILRTFYEGQPGLFEAIKQYYSNDNLSTLLTNVLSSYLNILQKESSTLNEHCGFLDCVITAVSFNVPITCALIQQLRVTLRAIDTYELSEACKKWCCSGLHRLHCLFRIYRSSLLSECMNFQQLADGALAAEAISLIHDDKPSVICPVYNMDTVGANSSNFRSMLVKSVEDSPNSVFRFMRSELTTYILKQCENNSYEGELMDEILMWAVEVSSGAFSSKVDSEAASALIDKMGEVPAFKLRHVYVFNAVLIGLTNIEIVQPFEKYSLSVFFGKTFTELFQSTRYSKAEWSADLLVMLEAILDECAQVADSSIAFTCTLARSLAKIIDNSGNRQYVCSRLRFIVGSRIGMLSSWVRRSPSPTALLADLSPLLALLVASDDIDCDELSTAMTDCVPYIIYRGMVEDLHRYFPVQVQSTDRFNEMNLNFRGHSLPLNQREVRHYDSPLEENRLIFLEALQLLCAYGSSETHEKILELTTIHLPDVVGVLDSEVTVLNGDESIESLGSARNQSVFRLMVSSTLLSYCGQLVSRVLPHEDNGYFSDSESLKNTINRKGGATALPAILRKAEPSGRNSSSARLCTFAATDQKFVQQHWYNCYTCRMVDSTGVCSVCAANCHRGHDIVYSKCGSFFCDCGATKCKSVTSCPPHLANASINAARGRVVPLEATVVSNGADQKFNFKMPENLTISKDVIVAAMDKLCAGFEQRQPFMENAIRASVDAHLAVWSVHHKKMEARTTLELTETIQIDYDYKLMDVCDVTNEYVLNVPRRGLEGTQDRIRCKDISSIVQLESGKQMWLMVEGNVMHIHHLQHGKNSDQERVNTIAHVDTETLPFSARRLSCLGDKVVVVGRNDVILLRFGREGEVVDRTPILIGEIATHTNPIVKAVWAPGRPAVVAIATIQFVRVYDITVDTMRPLEDLVLPVGNVEDLQVIENETGNVVLVLSSAGHLYRHTIANTPPATLNSSYFLTNTIEIPHSTGSALSFHYSVTSRVLMLSFDNATWFSTVPGGRIHDDNLMLQWRKLTLEYPLHCWQESSGIIGGLSYQHGSPVVYLYPTTHQLLIHKVENSNKRHPFTHMMFTSSTNDKVCAIHTFHDGPSALYTSQWESIPDMWISKLPVELYSNQGQPKEDPKLDICREDLGTMMEHCEALERVDMKCPDLLRFYDSNDLSARLSSVGRMPVTAVQKDRFSVTIQVLDPNVVMRAIRIEVPADRGPHEVEILGKMHNLTTTVARFFDILLTRSQSLELDRTVTLHFNGRAADQTVISLTSLRLYGISRREFGFPRAQMMARTPLSLPDSQVLQLVRLLAHMTDHGHVVKDMEWLRSIATQLCSLYKSAHKDLVAAGCQLLRAIMKKDMRAYYDVKDTIFFEDMKAMMAANAPIPTAIMPDLMLQIKYMLSTRYVPFSTKLKSELGGEMALLQFIYKQLSQCDSDSLALLEVFVALSFVFLAARSESREEITKLFLGVFTDPELAHLAQKLRLVAQTQIYSFSLSSRNDRAQARVQPQPLSVMQWGGLRPFFQKTKIITRDEDPVEVERMMGPLVSSEVFNINDMFEKDMEADFLVQLLLDVLAKIRDEGSLVSMPQQGTTISRNDTVPSTSLLILAIILMAQLYPARLFPTVVQLIGMVDWRQPSVVINELNYRQFLLVRLLSVLLSKCGEHVENRKKYLQDLDNSRKSESPEALSTDAPASSDAPAVASTNVADASSQAGEQEAAATTPDPATPPLDFLQPVPTSPATTVDSAALPGDTTNTREASPVGSDTTGTAGKRRSTEKLLEQIVTQLANAGALPFCMEMLSSLSSYWRYSYRESRMNMKLWSKDTAPPAADMGSLGIHTKPGVMDAHDHYLSMITEIALGLPYQMKKICKNLKFEEGWIKLLCEYVTFHQAPYVRRQSKKLLTALCGGIKADCRAVRDRYAMYSYVETLKKKFTFSNGVLTHQQLTEMVDVVSSLTTTAAERPAMWRQICEEQLNWLLQLACRIADPVSGNVLELLVAAIREDTPATPTGTPPADIEYTHLADRLIADEDNRGLVKMLLIRYLIGREESRRWLLHGMIRSSIQLASRQNQVTLVRILWTELWPLARGLGAHGAQLADLLASYVPRLLPASELLTVCDTELSAIRDIATRIEKEGHAGTYRQMTGLGLGWKFMLMVTSPCLNCFSRKENLEMVKLNSIKQDARFSANAMMVKLAGHYEISKVAIKLSDVKRAKVIKKVIVYYCPKVVESPVELKSSPELWQKAGSAPGVSGDGEVTISLAIPIVASSLIVQFAELAESRQNTELHCPRCSAVVPPNPGVCDQCGENAFQCVKCRSINYDDKDPFLCQTCGFCKYARMDVNVFCRPLPGVQPITSDTERAGGVETMSRLLVDMEQWRTQLHAGRTLCEMMWVRARPSQPLQFHMESFDAGTQLVNGMPLVNPAQHSVYGVLQALNYCKTAHEELCTQTQQLIALREELRNYDHATRAAPLLLHQAINQGFYSTSSQCFGCLCASILHSLAILQGACEDPACLDKLISDSAVYRELVELGQRYDPLKKEMETLMCRLAFENAKGTERLYAMTTEGVVSMSVLSKSILSFPDSLWQVKLRTLFKRAIDLDDENSSLSALLMTEELLSEGRPVRRRVYRKIRHRSGDNEADTNIEGMRRRVRVRNGKVPTSGMFGAWLGSNKEWQELQKETRMTTGGRNGGAIQYSQQATALVQEHEAWLWKCVFSPWITVRAAACRIIVELSRQPGHVGIAVSMVMRGVALAAQAPPHMTDQLFRAALAVAGRNAHVKTRLFLDGLHLWLMNAIFKECKRMYDEEHQETSMDHHFGTLLRCYVELLTTLFSGSTIESLLLKGAADHILVSLLQSTIFLKRVVLRRTRAVDAARLALERLLRRVSAKEPLVLLHTAVRSLDDNLDFYTQAQVVSVVRDVLDPEQQKEEDFLIQIDKDPAQEDFLQGRMTHNPYKSSDAGMGPLMRDIKNKICRDTEMIALMEDDNGMELLVNNQIISLSLPVAAVYDKLWRRHHAGQPMSIVYRMRGLLGDAVEPFVSTLGDGDGAETGEDAGLCTLVEAFGRCGGIARALSIVQRCDVTTGGRLLLTHMKRLTERCVKSEQGRRDFVNAGAVGVFVKVLQMCVEGHLNDEGVLAIGFDYLQLMGTLVNDVSTHKLLHHLTAADAKFLISLAMRVPDPGTGGYPSEWKRVHMQLMTGAAQLLGNLILGVEEAEAVLVDKCRRALTWKDIDVTTEVVRRGDSVGDVERLAEVVAGILPSEQGQRLKMKILDSGVISEACSYLVTSHPPLYSATETQEWKVFLMKPSLKLMLTFMHSMAKEHEATQRALAEKTLPILHRLEQVASDNSIGTLAENVMEALRQNEEVAAKIESVRQETKQKKRQMAMAMRNKQLSKMGMQMGKQGEVKVAARKIANEPALEEVSDPLAACCICRDSLMQPTRPAAAYAYAFACASEAGPVVTTVSQMVLVHVDCHQAAIRRSGGGRNADEWTKASLHNAGAKCNVMTPIASCETVSTAWNQALARFQSDLDVVIPTPLITRSLVFKDMCMLMDRFVNYTSFSEQSQGGGRESNAQYLAILHLLACVLPVNGNDLPVTRPSWRIYSFLMTEQTLAGWNEQRTDVLRAALDDAVTSDEMRSFSALRTICLSWALVDLYFRNCIPIDSDDRVEWLKKSLLDTFKRTPKLIPLFDSIACLEEFSEFAAEADLVPADFEAFFVNDQPAGAPELNGEPELVEE